MNEEDYGRIIAKNLKRIAYENGKSQADISRDLNISKQTLSSWMNGKRIPRMSKVDLLCSYFNCTRSDIMEIHADNFSFGGVLRRVPEEDVELLEAFHNAPDSIKQSVLILLGLKERG